MLAKQGWRLITNPSSLIARLYKARYFPNCEFWQAELGDTPSFSWRSILAGRPVLRASTRWRIGDGSKVNVWDDHWISNCSQYLVQRPIDSPVELVSDLIDESTRQWILALIYEVFHPAVASKILSIPLGRHCTRDMYYWHPNRRGWYTVKSAYWIAREQVLGNVLATSSHGDPFQELWKKLWKAKVPGRVQICAWRACCNLLPTRERLITKGYEGELSCLLCPYVVEDSAHIFYKCPIATTLLSQAPFLLHGTLLPNINFREWMLEQAMHLKMEVFEKLLMIIWRLWKNRNTKLWENKVSSASEVFFSCITWLEEFQKAGVTEASSSLPVNRVWSPASNATLTLNVDGAFLSQLTKGGVRGALRDSHGIVHAAYQIAAPFVSSALHAELLAIKAGLQLLSLHNFQSVCIQSDCLLAVQDINGNSTNHTEYGILIEDIQFMLQQVHVSYTPRTCNKIAHRLANLAFESEQTMYWIQETPECIRDIVLKELPPPT